jgi:uncharacterized protein (DUF433 family)
MAVDLAQTSWSGNAGLGRVHRLLKTPLLCYDFWQEESVMDLPDPLITISPDYLSGAPIFTGTRVPVQALFDYIEGGDPLDEFLGDFPNVTREHAVAVLEMARRAAISEAAKAAAE